jgi:hypothetical protein
MALLSSIHTRAVVQEAVPSCHCDQSANGELAVKCQCQCHLDASASARPAVRMSLTLRRRASADTRRVVLGVGQAPGLTAQSMFSYVEQAGRADLLNKT